MTTPLRSRTLGKPLTAKQQAVWDMKQAGKTRPQIAAELGVSENVISKQITYIRRKMGLAVREAPPALSSTDARSSKMLAPAKNHAGPPELVENAVDKVNQAMQDAGFQERVRASLVRRLRVKHEGEVTEVKPITDEQMKSQYREKIGLAFSYMDDKAMSEASFRDLSVGVTALTEKLQLLEGRPTTIISDLERKHLNELLPLLVAEGRRRGITIEGSATVVEAAK